MSLYGLCNHLTNILIIGYFNFVFLKNSPSPRVLNEMKNENEGKWRQMFCNAHHSPTTWILLQIWNMLYMQGGQSIFLNLRCSARKNGEKFQNKNWKTLRWLQEAFASCYSCPRRYKVLTDRVPKFQSDLKWNTFFKWFRKKIKQIVILLLNLRKCVLFNVVRFCSLTYYL